MNNGTGGATAAAQREQAGFTRVEPKRGYQYIAEQIREAIEHGRFRPGDRLPAERQMAEDFGVSRQGVREAVRNLESSGLVEIRVGVQGGAFVRSGDPTTVTRALSDLALLGAFSSQSLLEARILLTSDVVRLACERATEDDLQTLEDNTAAIERLVARPGARRTAQLTEFYRLLAAATHNEVLVALTDALAQIVHVRLDRVGPAPDPMIGAVRRSVIALIRARQADAAIDELVAHLRRLERKLEAAEHGESEALAVGSD